MTFIDVFGTVILLIIFYLIWEFRHISELPPSPHPKIYLTGPGTQFSDADMNEMRRRIVEADAWQRFRHQAFLDKNNNLINKYGWHDSESRVWTPILNPTPGRSYRKGPPNEHSHLSGLHLEKFSEVIATRRRLLEEENILATPEVRPGKGKLLLSIYSWSIYCTAAESVSNLWVDCAERPTWDSWVWGSANFGVSPMGGRAILAWVPDFAFEQVDLAIDATPYDNLHWVSHFGAEWSERLKATGLTG